MPLTALTPKTQGTANAHSAFMGECPAIRFTGTVPMDFLDALTIVWIILFGVSLLLPRRWFMMIFETAFPFLPKMKE